MPDPKARHRLLLLEDHETTRRTLRRVIELSLPDVEIAEAGSIAEGRQAVQEPLGPRWVGFICDERLPDGSGVELLDSLLWANPHAAGLLLTGEPNAELVNRVTKCGALFAIKGHHIDWDPFVRRCEIAMGLGKAR